MGIVKTKDLTFEYIRRDEEGNVEGITTAVDHVNIDLQAGQFIAVTCPLSNAFLWLEFLPSFLYFAI